MMRRRRDVAAQAFEGIDAEELLKYVNDPREVEQLEQLAVRLLEERTAQLERALDVLARVERIVTATGGYMSSENQAALFEARALLAEAGRPHPRR